MADYESTAYMSLERLKEQHGEELGKFQEMIRHQPARVKCSRELLELRRKQEALAKLGKYETWSKNFGVCIYGHEMSVNFASFLGK